MKAALSRHIQELGQGTFVSLGNPPNEMGDSLQLQRVTPRER
ncbi:hypothetical protein ACMHYB_26040 [Sorangium sp. So ce1128]